MRSFFPSVWLLLVSGMLLISSCGSRKSYRREGLDTLKQSFAENFIVLKGEHGYDCSVITKKKDHKVEDHFRLVDRNFYSVEQSKANLPVIPIPCKRIVCLSSTQLTYFFALDCLDPIVAINSSRHLFHKEMNRRVRSGVVKRIGKQGSFNLEMIAALQPDVIFVSPFKKGGYASLKQLGIPLIPMAAYSEETPLGRAEWVKFISLFIGKEKEADKKFKDIEKEYLRLKGLTENVKSRPTVISGKLRSGTWYVPGGDSFYAHYFRDAGAEYIFKDDYTGARPLDFETVYSKGIHADFWRLLLPEPVGFNREMLLKEDARYGDFDAFKNDKVFMCNIRSKPFYEENAMKPQVVLSDYIHLFHPELLPNYQPYFYEKLR
ncbi:ABC transporter substrate-binding protein [Halosquirtibacter laminarini]|uniref:ABC transporter substrate-binding protein n=1 Tax=Halosquirtibacter laminarini TaxID=3374600 RepID=A0AC61NCZ4_9BACT|nr:ABC transporter substrate-binding protein [Prolixibacteraceae bacterium]